MTVPDVTVIIPCYNAERWVGRAIRSALDQEGVTVEVIVVDDGSSDASLEVIASFGDRIRFETGPNRGACAARNRGRELARAPFLVFLDADDYFDPPFLRAGLDAMTRDGATIGFGPLWYEHPVGRTSRAVPTFCSPRGAASFLLREHFLTTSTCMFRRAPLNRLGGWRDALVCRQDVELFFRVLRDNPVVTSWQEGSAIYNQYPSADRVSAQLSIVHMRQTIDVLRIVISVLEDIGFSRSDAISMTMPMCYRYLRLAARTRNRAAYDALEQFRKELGYKDHSGSFTHRLTSKLLGLWHKESITGIWRAVKNTPSKHKTAFWRGANL